MKAHHYLLIIAAVLGILYFVSKKQKKQTKNIGTGTKTPTLEEQYPEPDTSAYADKADITTAEAIRLVKQSQWSDFLSDSENLEGDDPYSPYELHVGADYFNTECYSVSERTAKALIKVKDVRFYSQDVETYKSNVRLSHEQALEKVAKAKYSMLAVADEELDENRKITNSSKLYLIVGESRKDTAAKTYLINPETWKTLCMVDSVDYN